MYRICVAPVTTDARRAGLREHGRRAARSKRDQPERAREENYKLSHVRAAAGGALTDPMRVIQPVK